MLPCEYGKDFTACALWVVIVTFMYIPLKLHIVSHIAMYVVLPTLSNMVYVTVGLPFVLCCATGSQVRVFQVFKPRSI
jgi:hypothetical protein